MDHRSRDTGFSRYSNTNFKPVADPRSTSSPTTIAYGIVALYFVYYLLQYLDLPAISPLELLWNVLVYLIPAALLLDRTKRHDLRSSNMLSQTHAAKSEALRKIFTQFPGSAGVGGAVGLLQKLPGEGAALLNRRTTAGGTAREISRSSAPPGLGNWDNSCYQNSVLQGLAALDSLKDSLRFAYGENSVVAAHSTGTSLLETVEKLTDPANNGRLLWTPPKLKSMSSWQQQDAQEYFSKVMDELDKEAGRVWTSMNKTGGLESVLTDVKNINTIPAEDKNESSRQLEGWRNPVEGLLAQRVACTNCDFSEGLSMIPFNCLTVPLGSFSAYSLVDCLNEYTKLEEINEVECAKCTLLKWEHHLNKMLQSRLKVDSVEDDNVKVDKNLFSLPPELRVQTANRLNAIQKALDSDNFSDKTLNEDCQIPKKGRASSTKTRQAVVGRAPPSLVVHINRSVFDERTGAQSKNYAAVQYPLVLDLSSWMLSQTPREAGSESKDAHSARESMLLNSVNQDPNGLYRLKAVVTHYGRHENGHYICYRSHTKNTSDLSSELDEFDDEKMDECKPQWWRLSDEEVLSVSQQDVLDQGGVFMLFYEREVRDTILNSPAELEHAKPAKEFVLPVAKSPVCADEVPLSGIVAYKEPEQPMQDVYALPKPSDTSGPAQASSPPQLKSPIPENADTMTSIEPIASPERSPLKASTPIMRTAGSRHISNTSIKERKSFGYGNNSLRAIATS